MTYGPFVVGERKAPAGRRGFFDLYFHYRGLTITKNHFGESFISFVLNSLWVFWWFEGLTCDFAGQKREK